MDLICIVSVPLPSDWVDLISFVHMPTTRRDMGLIRSVYICNSICASNECGFGLDQICMYIYIYI